MTSIHPRDLLAACFFVFAVSSFLATSQLDSRYYDRACPNLRRIVRNGVLLALSNDSRMAASLLRLHFHDCIVNGCDGSVLLDDTSTMTGEKNAIPNKNSLRGYDVIDNIKANVEQACPCTVSCTDILTLVARDAVYLAGGPFWIVALGRQDGLTASGSDALQQLPNPNESLDNIIDKFTTKGLEQNDVVILSGAHTIGFAQCATFKQRLFNFDGTGEPDPNLDDSLLANLQQTCPDEAGSNTNLAPLDPVTTKRFDNVYYSNLVKDSGLLQSDQALIESNETASMVLSYSRSPRLFFRDFANSMVKLGRLGVLTGSDGEIRNLNSWGLGDERYIESIAEDSRYYDRACPNLRRIVRNGVLLALSNDSRMAASLLRLHFHDCIVNGCDGSVLLDDTSTMTGEKNAIPNKNSLRGYEVIDNIKANVEQACPCTVSCTDILTLVARDAVYLAGGPFWIVALGRQDGFTASGGDALQQLPNPNESLDNIIDKFTTKGLDQNDVIILSGAHTIGFAQCATFKQRLFNFEGTGEPYPNLDDSLLANLQQTCPDQAGSNTNLAPLDPVTTKRFDNVYYLNLVKDSGLLQSDQALIESNETASMVLTYSRSPRLFFRDFAHSMVKLGRLGVLTGSDGEIRQNCRLVN